MSIFSFRWMATFKNHAKDSIKRLKKGEKLRTRGTAKAAPGKATKGPPQGILKKPTVVNILYIRITLYLCSINRLCSESVCICDKR